ncbi:hypothetical protein FKM82_009201 [Ascaphus truei]
MEAQCLTLKNMLEPPKLLRRPLPPKVLPALTVQKQKPINHEEIIPSWPEEQLHEIPLLQSDGYEDDVQRLYEPAAASPLEKIKRIHEKWILDQLAATPAASPLNSADFPLNFKHPDPLRHVQTKYKYSVLDQTKERDSTMHSGPADFPSPTHHRKLPVTVLPLVNDPRYQPPPPEFTLSDIIAQSADHPKCVTEILNKPILSRQQYSNMDRLVTGLQRKKQSKVHTVVLSTSNIPEMSRRVPLQQQLILAEQQKRMSKEGGKENLTHAAEQQKEMSKEGGKENLTNAGADTLHQLLKSQYLQDSENICSEMNDDHENVFVTHCELALLESLVHGGNTLSLKAFFISRLPDLTTLRNTLLYLNLSFNEFRHFPTEKGHNQNLC